MSGDNVKTVRVRVKASGKKESVVAIDEDRFVITIREPAAQNRANHRVREIVAQHFAVPSQAVTIVAGHRSPTKRLEVTTSQYD